MKRSFLTCLAAGIFFLFPLQTLASNTIQAELDAYAQTLVATLAAKERETAPILRKSQNGKGYIATYTRVPPTTKARTSYAKAPKFMPDAQYIGKIFYTRLRYTSVASKAVAQEALAGPFSVKQEIGTILVRYKDGQWMPI